MAKQATKKAVTVASDPEAEKAERKAMIEVAVKRFKSVVEMETLALLSCIDPKDKPSNAAVVEALSAALATTLGSLEATPQEVAAATDRIAGYINSKVSELRNFHNLMNGNIG